MKMFKWVISLFRRMLDWMRGSYPVEQKAEEFIEQLTDEQKKQIQKQMKRNAARKKEARFKPSLVWVGSACRQYGISRRDFCAACGVPPGS